MPKFLRRIPMPFALRFPRRKAAILALLFVLASLSAHAQESPAAQTHGVVVANMDRSIKPGDNFWLYANGDWIKRTEIPSDRSYVGIWDTLSNLSRKNTEALIEEAAKANAPAGSNARKMPTSTTPSWTNPPSSPAASLRCARTSTPSPPSR